MANADNIAIAYADIVGVVAAGNPGAGDNDSHAADPSGRRAPARSCRRRAVRQLAALR